MLLDSANLSQLLPRSEKKMQDAAAEIRELRRFLAELTEGTLKELVREKKNAYLEVDKPLEAIHKPKAEAEPRAGQTARKKNEAQEELMKQSGENDRLRRLLAHDETNFSFPTSANKYNPRKKKRIANNRHKTGNKPGALLWPGIQRCPISHYAVLDSCFSDSLSHMAAADSACPNIKLPWSLVLKSYWGVDRTVSSNGEKRKKCK